MKKIHLDKEFHIQFLQDNRNQLYKEQQMRKDLSLEHKKNQRDIKPLLLQNNRILLDTD